MVKPYQSVTISIYQDVFVQIDTVRAGKCDMSWTTRWPGLKTEFEKLKLFPCSFDGYVTLIKVKGYIDCWRFD